jgi:DNA-binding NtrC family response regulator
MKELNPNLKKTTRLRNSPGKGRNREMNGFIPKDFSVNGRVPQPKRRAVQPSGEKRTKYLNRMAVRLSHEAPLHLKDVIGELEKEIILRVLKEAEGNQKDAALILGMKYTTLNEKLKRYGVRVKRVSTILL